MQGIFSTALISCLLALSSPCTKAQGQHLYTLHDLEVLYQQKDTAEFLKHALDVRPSKRPKLWATMVQEMANQFLKSSIQKGSLSPKDVAMVDKLSTWPILRKDEFFVLDRAKFYKLYLKHCFSKKLKGCPQKVRSVWEQLPQKADIGIQLAGILMDDLNYRFTPKDWSFFSLATHSEYSEFYCRNQVFLKGAFFMLDHIRQKWPKKGQIRQKVDEYFGPSCWGEIAKALKAHLSPNPKQQGQWVLAFEVLNAKGALSTADRDFYLTLYFLLNAQVGDSLTEAFVNLDQLKNNYQRRAKTLQRLRQVDPLPGHLFSLKSASKKTTLIRKLFKSFPEYVNLYAQTCLAYLEATVTFEHGNPTIDCHNLMQASVGKKWVSPILRKRYQKAVNFSQ